MIRRKRFRKLCETESCEYSEDIDFVAEVEVELLIDWEGRRHGVKSDYESISYLGKFERHSRISILLSEAVGFVMRW